MGTYLDEARKGRGEGEPDFCSLVVKTAGEPGHGWGNLGAWAKEVQLTHQYWADRIGLDNADFEHEHGSLPAIPGL